MTSDTSIRPVSPLRARMIEDMTVRGFNEHTRRDYIRHVRSFTAFIGRSPDTAAAEDLRLFQLHQTRIGMQPPSINARVERPGPAVDADESITSASAPTSSGSPFLFDRVKNLALKLSNLKTEFSRTCLERPPYYDLLWRDASHWCGGRIE